MHASGMAMMLQVQELVGVGDTLAVCFSDMVCFDSVSLIAWTCEVYFGGVNYIGWLETQLARRMVNYWFEQV